MKWWDTYVLERDQWAKWQIGPLLLFAQTRTFEWIFAWEPMGDPLTDTYAAEIPSKAAPNGERCRFSRYAFSDMSTQLLLEPRLGDRPFIVRTDDPLYLLAGEQTVLFVSTVVWIAACLYVDDQGDPRTLIELPAARPSDTWFGPNTREGELCYASRTHARTDLASIGPRPHRAITAVEISNHGSDSLSLEQLRVPVPALSLHHDEQHRLWTDAVCLVREEGQREASLTVMEASKHLPSGTTLLSSPRRPIEAGTIVEAFSRFLS